MMRIDNRLVRFEKNTGGGMNSLEEIDAYVKIANRPRFFRSLAKKALELNPNAKEIADIGSGPGFLAIQLSKLSGRTVKAVDIAPNMLMRAQALAAQEHVGIETIVADCRDLPFDDHSLDLVVSSGLLHMLEDVRPFLMEVKRITKPGGAAVITGFRRDTWNIIRKLADFQSDVLLRGRAIDGLGRVLRASFTAGELQGLLQEVGITRFNIQEGVLQLFVWVRF